MTVHRRWGCVDRRSNRSKVEGKLTVGLPKARWSDYREGSAVRWARHDWSGTKSAFASQWWISVCFAVVDRRSLRFGAVFGSAFASQWWIGVWDTRWSAFGSQVLSVFGSFSLSLTLRLFAKCVWFAECVSLFYACYGKCLKVKRLCKMISRSTSANFGQTEIIFRKIYFP